MQSAFVVGGGGGGLAHSHAAQYAVVCSGNVLNLSTYRSLDHRRQTDGPTDGMTSRAIANTAITTMQSLLSRLSTRRYPHLLLGAGAPAACGCRSIFLARGALSSKPTACRRCWRSMGQTDGQTD